MDIHSSALHLVGADPAHRSNCKRACRFGTGLFQCKITVASPFGWKDRQATRGCWVP